MKIFLTSLLALGLFANSILWTNDLAKAKEVAKAENKHILLNFSGSDWCAPCILLKREALSTEEFENYASKELVLLNADFPRLKKNKLSTAMQEINDGLAEKYNTEGKFPLTLLLDSDGLIIKSWDGYKKGQGAELLAEIISLTNE